MPAWKTERLKRLARTLLSLKREAEVLAFLRDIATIEELRELANRWEVAQELHEKKSYREIEKRTGISTATITRIAHWIRFGEGGYRTALSRLKNPPKPRI